MVDEAWSGPERRCGKRMRLPVAVRVRIPDGPTVAAKVRDVNSRGMALEAVVGAQAGDQVTIEFDGFPEVCAAFSLVGRVTRVIDPTANAVAFEIDRKATPMEGTQGFKTLVLYYLRHKPLLENVTKGYFEGRCGQCGWVGRVGERSPRCARCGGKVEPMRT